MLGVFNHQKYCTYYFASLVRLPLTGGVRLIPQGQRARTHHLVFFLEMPGQVAGEGEGSITQVTLVLANAALDLLFQVGRC